MESSILRSYHNDLSRHPLFRGLGKEDFASLGRYYQLVKIPGGAEFLFPGDAADSFYLLLSGEVHSDKHIFFQGDFWGLENLLKPGICTHSFQAVKETVFMRLRAEGFRRMLKDFPGLSKHFRPVKDREDHLIQGLPRQYWSGLKKYTAIREKKGAYYHYRSRTSRKVFSFSLIVPLVLILGGVLFSGIRKWIGIAVPLGMGILFFQFFLRNLTLYKISDRAVVKRYFNFRKFRQDQQILPIDQIQTVVVSIRGLVSKILQVGDLQVQTAGNGLVFNGIDKPAQLQARLMELKKRAATEEKGREREALRTMMEERFSNGTSDQLLYEGDRVSVQKESLPSRRVFRKTPCVLIFQTFLPLGLVFACLFALILTPFKGIPVLWIPGGLLIVAGLGRSLWVAADWWNDIYMIKFPYIWDIERKPLGKEDVRKQTELGLILNVTAVQKGLIRLLLNFGDVEIETAGRGAPLIFYSVMDPFDVQDELLRYREHFLRIQERNRRDRAKEDFMEFTEILEQTRRRDRLVRDNKG